MAAHMTDPGDGWLVAWCACGQCLYRWVAILEPGCSGDGLACPECGALDARLVQASDPPTAVELRTWPAEDRDKYLRAASERAGADGYPGEWFCGGDMARDDRELTYAQRLWPPRGAAPAPPNGGNASVARRRAARSDGMAPTGGMTLTIYFGLPRTLLSINARRRMHWAKEATLVRDQRTDAAWAARAQTQGLARPVFTGRVRVDLTIHPRKSQHRPDDLALWEACKPWLDGLQDAGIVADDRQCVAGTLVWADERTAEVVLTVTDEEG